MKKLIVLMLVASFTGAVIAQQAPVAPQTGTPAKTTPVKKDKKHHHKHPHKPAGVK